MAPRSRTLSSSRSLWFAFRRCVSAGVLLSCMSPLVGCSSAADDDDDTGPSITPGKPNEYADPSCNAASGVSSNGGGSGVSDCRVSNCSPRVRLFAVGFSAPGGAERLSSTMQFHCPHAPHWPAHLP